MVQCLWITALPMHMILQLDIYVQYITDDVRVSIVTKLAHGVNIDNILDYVRDRGGWT